ncbi:MAG: 23S rRNA (adenine(2030)-N(6))-methyltransferase RlmJ [Myxococcota bacterium]
MLAYRHQFHAGNFADVFKHALLVQLVRALAQKDKPFFCLDTHAGSGRYDFAHRWAQQNKEHLQGIALAWERKDVPPEVAPYLDAVRAENPDGKLRHYPGSPLLIRQLLRADDRMALTELNKTDHEALETLFGRDRQVQVRRMDAYEGLKAFLPPKERRGLVFVDSAFDRAQEFDRMRRAFAAAHRRFATGVYALWYPLMEPAPMQAFERGLAAARIPKLLQIELSVKPLHWRDSLRGTGMLVANPPFGFEKTAKRIVEWLWPVLSTEGKGGTQVRWLAGE